MHLGLFRGLFMVAFVTFGRFRWVLGSFWQFLSVCGVFWGIFEDFGRFLADSGGRECGFSNTIV